MDRSGRGDEDNHEDDQVLGDEPNPNLEEEVSALASALLAVVSMISPDTHPSDDNLVNAGEFSGAAAPGPSTARNQESPADEGFDEATGISIPDETKVSGLTKGRESPMLSGPTPGWNDPPQVCNQFRRPAGPPRTCRRSYPKQPTAPELADIEEIRLTPVMIECISIMKHLMVCSNTTSVGEAYVRTRIFDFLSGTEMPNAGAYLLDTLNYLRNNDFAQANEAIIRISTDTKGGYIGLLLGEIKWNLLQLHRQ